MGYDQFATPLLGTRRNEIPIRDAIGGVLEGILDGYERFRAVANSVSDQKERLRRAAQRPLSLVLVDADEKKLQEMQSGVELSGREGAVRTLKLFDVVRGGGVARDSITDLGDADVQQEPPVPLLRVTRGQPAVAAAAPGLETEVFQFSAMSERAAVPVREQEVNASLLRQLPDRVINAASPRDRQRCSTCFANLMIPDDFIR